MIYKYAPGRDHLEASGWTSVSEAMLWYTHAHTHDRPFPDAHSGGLCKVLLISGDQTIGPHHTTAQQLSTFADGWRFSVAVMRWSLSMQLLYIEPG